jgi:SAM-dependent methyltransferase
MCNNACLKFIQDNLSPAEVKASRVLEVGALDVNGTPRETVERLRPHSYTGVDLSAGPGVDEVCDVSRLIGRFGRDSFDVVVSTEMLEHVRDWRAAITNLKGVLKPGGLLLITTRSLGYPYHGYPDDFWRFEEEDLRSIFSDMTILIVTRDPLVPGIFIKAAKPAGYAEKDLSPLELYSIIARKRRLGISSAEILLFMAGRTVRERISNALPEALKRFLRRMLRADGPGAAGRS